MSEQLLRSLTSVLLELPFSRRAETEADLIGEAEEEIEGVDTGLCRVGAWCVVFGVTGVV